MVRLPQIAVRQVTLNALCRPADMERVVRVDRVVKLGWLIPALIVVAVLAFIGIEIWFLTQAR